MKTLLPTVEIIDFTTDDITEYTRLFSKMWLSSVARFRKGTGFSPVSIHVSPAFLSAIVIFGGARAEPFLVVDPDLRGLACYCSL